MARLSSLVAPDIAKHVDQEAVIHEADLRLEAHRILDLIQTRASTILLILMASDGFSQVFLCNGPQDLHLFTHASMRIIVLDVLTRCSVDQVANFDTFDFTAHQKFEKRITKYTRTSKKPNPNLSKCRSWDVALNVILKVEALDAETAIIPTSRLLFREYAILKYIWDCYLRENMELDEMTGIPMVFDYTEVPNTEFNYEPSFEFRVVDIFGTLIPWTSDNQTTMSYLSLEKLGPNIKFLQDLMFFTKRRTRKFDLPSAFKVFDQLLCRCLQLHRFGVVHNCIEPRNIYFGRSATFDVVYLANYGKSMILDFKDRKAADVFIGGDQRYISYQKARGSWAYPFHDIESAFYCLLSMIVSTLPWDAYLAMPLRTSIGTDYVSFTSNSNLNISNDSQRISDGIEPHRKLREIKLNFWKTTTGITRVLADLRYLSNGEEAAYVNRAVETIRDIYSRMRDYLQTVGSRPSPSFSANLLSPQSTDYQFYMDLRRSTLLFFRFDSVSGSLCTATYQKKIESMTRDEQELRPAWNISNWCFNAVLMNAPGNIRLSMAPVEAVFRSKAVVNR